MLQFEQIIENLNNIPIERYTFDNFFGAYKSLYEVDSIHSSFNRWEDSNGITFVSLFTDKEDRAWHIYRYMNDSIYVILKNEVVYSIEIENIIKNIINKNH